MGIPTKLRVGQNLRKFPGNTMNWLVERVNELLAGGGSEQAGPSGPRRLMIRNDTGGHLTDAFAILRVVEPFNDPELNDNEEVLRAHVRLLCDTPDQDTADGATPFVIVQKSVRQDGVTLAVVSGPSWVKVDIQEADPTVCGPTDGDSDKLTSGQGGTPILWAPDTVTGEKFCLVNLGKGEGGGGASVVYGRAVERVDEPAQIQNPAWIDDGTGDDPNPPGPDPPAEAKMITNPDLWKNGFPEQIRKANDEPTLTTDPWVFNDPEEAAEVGEPFLYGRVSVVLFEPIPQTDPDSVWPVRYWERMKIQVTGDLADPPNDQFGDPHPRFIDNPDYTGTPPQDPDDDGNPRFLPNEDRYVTAYWDNPNLVCVTPNMWVSSIGRKVQTASPTVFRTPPIPTV